MGKNVNWTKIHTVLQAGNNSMPKIQFKDHITSYYFICTIYGKWTKIYKLNIFYSVDCQQLYEFSHEI